ncbi:MAG: hypothetical protein ACKO34_06775 [Vampirovibrionales bacterium]
MSSELNPALSLQATAALARLHAKNEEGSVAKTNEPPANDTALAKAKQRWYPEVILGFDEFQGTHYRVSDVVADPLKHAVANTGLLAGGLGLLMSIAFCVSQKKPLPSAEEASKLGLTLLALSIPTFAYDYFTQWWSNKRAETISKTMGGGNPTFADWKAYQASHHPEKR